jgi:hypothetical protein
MRQKVPFSALTFTAMESLWFSFVSFDENGVMTGFRALGLQSKTYEKLIKRRNFALMPVLGFYTNLASHNSPFWVFLGLTNYIEINMINIMNSDIFFNEIKKKIIHGLVFKNPGGGTSTIILINSKNRIHYRRGNSDIYIKIDDIFKAFNHFRKTKCTSIELKYFLPNVFKVKGCNCTFFFLILNRLSLCSKIKGSGKKQSPFFVEIY